MYKKLMTFLLFAFLIVIGLNSNIKIVKASSGESNDGSATFNSKVTTNENIYGMNHVIDKGIATSKGAKHNQLINVFEMKTDGFSSKLVNWAMQTNNAEYARVTIMAAARDYEKKHPGWIVLGGINADQYYFKYGKDLASDGSIIYCPQPYYPMISDGENRFTVNPYGNASSIVGFKNKNVADSFVTNSGGAGGYVVTIYNEDGSCIKAPVDGINTSASENQITVWSPKFSDITNGKCDDLSIKSSNDIYIIEDAELAYLSNSRDFKYQNNTMPGIDSFFGRGYISTAKDEYTLGKGQFAIEVNNNEYKKYFEIGKKVVVEQEFANPEMNECDEGVGYHAVHRTNGVDGVGQGSYDLNLYNRSLFGKKADGTYVLITADKVPASKTDGLNFEECNAVADAYGVTDLYQMDGGGSVTAMIRDKDGKFVVTNVPRDSGNPKTPRSNFNYLFFVARDPGVIVDQYKVTYHSATLEKIKVDGAATVENIKVKVNDKIYDFDQDKLVIDGLKENQTYDIYIDYDIVLGNDKVHKQYTVSITTPDYRFPVMPFKVGKVSKNSIEIIKKSSDVSLDICDVKIKIDDKVYEMGKEESFICDDLEGSSEYDIYISYGIFDHETENIYYKEEELPLQATTKSFELPVIDTFKLTDKDESSLKFEYAYTDLDGVVTDVYISCNGNQYKINSKKGKFVIDDLDFTKEKYSIYFILVYQDRDTGEVGSINSEEIVIEQEAQPEPIVPEKKGCGCKKEEGILALMSSIALCAFIIIRKKY